MMHMYMLTVSDGLLANAECMSVPACTVNFNSIISKSSTSWVIELCNIPHLWAWHLYVRLNAVAFLTSIFKDYKTV